MFGKVLPSAAILGTSGEWLHIRFITVGSAARFCKILGAAPHSPGEDSVRRLLGDLDPEGEPVPDPHGLHLLLPRVQDADPGGGRLGRGGDADHVGVPDGHHAEGDVLAAGVVGAPHLVDLVRLGHHHAVPLYHHRVGVHSALTQREKYVNTKECFLI